MTLSKDYNALRIPEMKDVHREYAIEGGTKSTYGPEKPYNLLLEGLQKATAKFSDTRTNTMFLQRLAWFLGESGETDACEVIVEQIDESWARRTGGYW